MLINLTPICNRINKLELNNKGLKVLSPIVLKIVTKMCNHFMERVVSYHRFLQLI